VGKGEPLSMLPKPKATGLHWVGDYRPTNPPGAVDPGAYATKHNSGAYVHYEQWVPQDDEDAEDMRRIAEQNPWSTIGQQLMRERADELLDRWDSNFESFRGRSSSPTAPSQGGAPSSVIRLPPALPQVAERVLPVPPHMPPPPAPVVPVLARPEASSSAPPPGQSPAAMPTRGRSASSADPRPGKPPAARAPEAAGTWLQRWHEVGPQPATFSGLIPPQKATMVLPRPPPMPAPTPARGKGPYSPARAPEATQKGKGTPPSKGKSKGKGFYQSGWWDSWGYWREPW